MFLTLEGGEGSGKTTLAQGLHKTLKERGFSALHTREPGAGALGKKLREILLGQADFEIDALAETFLFMADRAQHLQDQILPALNNGAIVICDRFADSTIAYQGYGRGCNIDLLKKLNSMACGPLSPSFTLLLDIPVEAGLARALARNEHSESPKEEGRFEAETLEFHQRVREGFLKLAENEPERFIVLNALESPEVLLKKALEELSLKGAFL